MTKICNKSEIDGALENLQNFILKHPRALPYALFGYRTKLADAQKEYPNFGLVAGTKFLGSSSFVATKVLVSDSWVTGGVTGGNCWGGEANELKDGEKPPEDWALDTFLREYYPEVSYLKYKSLEAKVVQEEFTEREYYGNYTHFAFYTISFDDIIAVLEDA